MHACANYTHECLHMYTVLYYMCMLACPVSKLYVNVHTHYLPAPNLLNVATCRAAQDLSDLSRLPVPPECAGPPQATAESTPR